MWPFLVQFRSATSEGSWRNRLRFDKVTESLKVGAFWDTVYYTVFGKTKIMLSRFIATCNVARWLCHWNLLFCLSPTSPATRYENYLPCGPLPPTCTWIFNTRAPHPIGRHVRTRIRTQNLRTRTDADAKMSASAYLWPTHYIDCSRKLIFTSIHNNNNNNT